MKCWGDPETCWSARTKYLSQATQLSKQTGTKQTGKQTNNKIDQASRRIIELGFGENVTV